MGNRLVARHACPPGKAWRAGCGQGLWHRLSFFAYLRARLAFDSTGPAWQWGANSIKHRGVSMSKPARGTKRVCPNCGARFYDLNRTPITCPVCQAVYQVTPPTSRRGERAAPEPRKVVEPEVEAPVIETADVISLEEVEEAGADVPVEEDEEIVDLGDDAPEIPAASRGRHLPRGRRGRRGGRVGNCRDARRGNLSPGVKTRGCEKGPLAPLPTRISLEPASRRA